MAPQLLLIIFINFFHDVKAEALLQPKLTVDRPVITETDSVTLNCVTPSSVSVDQCYFFIQNQKTFDDFSCVQTLTGAELLKLANRKSPVDVKVTCFYRVKLGVFESTSPYSATTTIIINNLHPPTLTVNPLVITKTDSVTLNCVTPSSVSVDECYFIFMRRKPAKRFSCLKTLTGSELLSSTEQSSPANIHVTCFYLSSQQSPESNMSNIIIQFPRPELRVNPTLITETDSVTLNCVTPSSVSVDQCYLYFMRSKTARTISCVQTLPGSELLFLTDQSSPAEVELRCYYTLEQRGGQYLSPNSNITSVNIQISTTTPAASAETFTEYPVTSLASITDVVKTDSTTSQTPAVSVSTDLTVSSPTWNTKSFFSTSLTSVKPASDPTVSTAAETFGSLFTSQRSFDKVSDDTIIQPAAFTETFTEYPVTSLVSITETEQKPSKKNNQLVPILILLVLGFGVAVGVILLGGTLLCFCQQRGRRRRIENFFHTRSQATSPGDVSGLIYSHNNRVLPVEKNNGNCMITSELQQMNRQDSQNETPNVYHVYATIIDEPAASTPSDTTYCTVQAH